MALLILGLALFFGAHLLPVARGTRAALIARLGAKGYKGLFSLVSLAGLVLIVIGYRAAPFQPVYEPLEKARGLAHAAMPFAFILVAGANMKSNLKRYVAHPMSLGVLLWSLVHLSANGDLASLLVFGAFAVFSVLDMTVISSAKPTPPVQPRVKDLILVVAGTVTYAAAMWAHGAVFGYPVIG